MPKSRLCCGRHSVSDRCRRLQTGTECTTAPWPRRPRFCPRPLSSLCTCSPLPVQHTHDRHRECQPHRPTKSSGRRPNAAMRAASSTRLRGRACKSRLNSACQACSASCALRRASSSSLSAARSCCSRWTSTATSRPLRRLAAARPRQRTSASPAGRCVDPLVLSTYWRRSPQAAVALDWPEAPEPVPEPLPRAAGLAGWSVLLVPAVCCSARAAHTASASAHARLRAQPHVRKGDPAAPLARARGPRAGLSRPLPPSAALASRRWRLEVRAAAPSPWSAAPMQDTQAASEAQPGAPTQARLAGQRTRRWSSASAVAACVASMSCGLGRRIARRALRVRAAGDRAFRARALRRPSSSRRTAIILATVARSACIRAALARQRSAMSSARKAATMASSRRRCCAR